MRKILYVAALVAACNSGKSDPSAAGGSQGQGKTPPKRGTIGVSLLTLENPFFKVIGDHITAEGAKYGYDTTVVSADRDAIRHGRTNHSVSPSSKLFQYYRPVRSPSEGYLADA